MRGLYAITPDLIDTALLLHKVEQSLIGGVRLLQYRNKLASSELALQQATALRALTRQYQTTLIINDNADLAVTVEADGVHLGGEDGDLAMARATLPKIMLIGASCYNDLSLAHQAIAAGADYIAFGAIFTSSTKPAAKRASLELLQQARAEFSLPIVAIGGITEENVPSVIATGVDCLALISTLYEAEDIASTATRMCRCFT